MLAVPTFDVFPWSWHRLAGLVALLALTPTGTRRRLDVPSAGTA
jgi:hypothetical protein